MIRAALLANEQDGVIKLLIQNSDHRLVIVPTGNKPDWPAYTLEDRIVPDKKAFVSDVVKNWILEKSVSPSNRAITLGKIMLTLRGYCKVTTSFWGIRTYTLVDNLPLLSSQDTDIVAQELLSNCKATQPEIWKLLNTEIAATIKNLKIEYFDKRSEEDAWLTETFSDREKFKAHLHSNPIRISSIAGIGICLLLIGLLYYLITLSGQYIFAAVTAMLVALFLILSSSFKRLKDIDLLLSDLLDSIVKLTIVNKTIANIIAIIFFPIMILLVYVYVTPLLSSIFHTNIFESLSNDKTTRILFNELLSVFLVTGSTIFVLLRIKAGKAITSNVVNKEEKEEALPPGLPLTRNIQNLHNNPVKIEILTADTIPAPSAECISRLEVVASRGLSIRLIYRKGLLLFALSTLLLPTLYRAFSYSKHWKQMKDDPDFFFGIVSANLFILFALTVILLLKPGSKVAIFLRKLLSRVLIIGYFSSTTLFDGTEKFTSIRVVGLQVLEAIWLIVAFQTILSYSAPPTSLEILFTLVSLINVAIYLFWMRKNKQVLEEKYPYKAPLNLLALRVFGSSSMADFLELSNSWQWIGTRQRLDGPDTSGNKMSDLINYFRGRIDKSIVEDKSELEEAFKLFKTKPDYELRFAVNSMQCSNATWKEALGKSLDAADVIVVDLSGLSEKNHGIAYEIEKLINEIPFHRIIFLVNDSSDMRVINDILHHAWNNISPDSPNKVPSIQTIQFFRMVKRHDNETTYEWKLRQSKGLNNTSLVSLLYNAALPAKNPASIDPKRDIEAIRWTRFPMPEPVRKLVYLLCSVYLLYIAIIIFIYFTLSKWVNPFF